MRSPAVHFLLLHIAASLTSCAKPWEITYLMFSQQWSAGSCEGEFHHRCVERNERNFWTIHGMWPSNGHGSPEFCNRTLPYNGTELQPLYDQLQRYWPSYVSKSSDQFWEHEWRKHGTCATGIPALSGITHYFNSTLNFYLRHNITRYLEDSGISPTLNRAYSVEDIEEALTNHLGGAPNFVCYRDRDYPEPLLTEIRICLNKLLQPLDCEEEHDRCGRRVFYIPLDINLWGVHTQHTHYETF